MAGVENNLETYEYMYFELPLNTTEIALTRLHVSRPGIIKNMSELFLMYLGVSFRFTCNFYEVYAIKDTPLCL